MNCVLVNTLSCHFECQHFLSQHNYITGVGWFEKIFLNKLTRIFMMELENNYQMSTK